MTMAAVRADDPASLFATPTIVAERRADGSVIVSSTTPLQPATRCVGDWLEHWARVAPARIFLGERAGDAPWTTVTYGEALRQVRSIAAWILAQGLSVEHPLAVLSDNSVDHALLALGAMHAGVPVAAISPAYSLMSQDFDKLKSMIALLEPGAIYVSGTKPFAAALAAIKPLHRRRSSAAAPMLMPSPSASVAATPETPDVAKAFAAVTPDTIAKFLFTSGSTGTPKAVINTQRMLTSSQQAKAQTWTFLERVGDDSSFSTGCPGATPSAPTTISTWCCATAARSMSTAASRRRGCSIRRWRTCAGDADGLFQRAARLRHADRGAARRRGTAPEILLARSNSPSMPARRCRRICGTRSKSCSIATVGRQAADGVGVGLDRDLAARHRLSFPGKALRQYRRADSGHRAEAGARRATSSRCACAAPTSRPATGRRRS